MAISLKHAFTSGKSDGADVTLVQPSNWNAEHTLTLGTGRLLGRTTAGTGAAEEISAGTGLTLSGGTLSVTGSTYQPLDGDLTALAGLAANGLVARTATDTMAVRTITQPAAGITVTNGDGVSGNPTLALANDLAALEALSGTNTIYYRSGSDAWSAVSIGTGLSFSTGTLSATVGKPVLLFLPSGNEPPSSNYATFNTRNLHPTLDFDTTTQETAIWTAVLPSVYAGGGLTVDVYFAAATATTGTIGWDVAIERIDASSLDIDADSFATAQTITAATVPGTSGQILKSSVAITSGANLDSLAAGEAFRIRLRRDVANDTATGDAQMIAMLVRET